MKQKRLIGILLAVLWILTVSPLSAVAATTYTLTLNNTGETTHTFDVYQVFSGDLSVNALGQKILSNIEWGSSVTAGARQILGNAADKAATLTTEAAATAFANELLSNYYLIGSQTKIIAAGGTDTVTLPSAGYYLIKDRDYTQDQLNGVYTSYILRILGDATVSAKISTPTVEKKTRDINDSIDASIANSPWVDSADHDIGDTVPFMLIGTLPDNFAAYAVYSYTFSDELCAGLTYQNDAQVFVDNGAGEIDITAQTTITQTAIATGTSLQIAISDLKALTGVTVDAQSRILVRYTAILNANAVIGADGNPNTVSLTYSNNPNVSGAGTSTTPIDKAVIFTYRVVINKTDGSGTALANAGFTLYKKNATGTWDQVQTFAAGADTTFTFNGLDDGDYKLVESTVPTGYNRMNDIEFTIIATHETNSANPQLLSLNGTTANGETITLSGTQQATVSLCSGSITATIANRAGSTLPTTGGAGTVILYTLGGILTVGALIFFLAKRRMSAIAAE